MNRVSSAVGSKLLTTSLLPSSSRLAAVKPEPVSSLKRLSASATAPDVGRIELVPRVAGVVHHDLRCHGIAYSSKEGRWQLGRPAEVPLSRGNMHCDKARCGLPEYPGRSCALATLLRATSMPGQIAVGRGPVESVTTPRNGPVLCSTSPPHAQRDSSHLCEDQRSDRNRGPYDPPVVLAQIIHDVVSPARGPVKCGSDEKHPGARRVFVGRAAPPFMQAIPDFHDAIPLSNCRWAPNFSECCHPCGHQPSTPK